ASYPIVCKRSVVSTSSAAGRETVSPQRHNEHNVDENPYSPLRPLCLCHTVSVFGSRVERERNDHMSIDNPLVQRANALLATMSLEEKAGQLSQYFYFGGWTAQNDLVENQVRAGQAGSLLFVAEARETNRLQRIAVEESRLGIPLLFGFDVIHGLRTIAPVPLGMAASWDAQVYERVQAMAAREARAVGIHWAFAPMLDIARDPRWRR